MVKLPLLFIGRPAYFGLTQSDLKSAGEVKRPGEWLVE